MKIAFIVTAFPRLSETPILNQITGLLDRAHEVDIYAQERAPESKIHPDVEKYRLLQRTYYEGVPRNKCWRLLKGIGIILANFHRNPRIILNALNIFRFGRNAIKLNILYSVAPFLEKSIYDIVHCQFGPNGNKAIILKEVGVIKGKLITTFRGYDMYKLDNQSADHVYERLFDEGDLFLVVSEQGKSRLIELGCDEKKILVHRSGVDCKKFHFTLRQPSVNGQIRLVTIARLVEIKGVEYSIRAVAKLAELNPNIKYHIIGDGPLMVELQQLIHKLNIDNIVELLGEKQQQEIIEILNNTHILLASSITDKDGRQDALPNVLKEAMASGLPIISTQYSGIPELVENGVSGFLVPEKDVDTLAEKLCYLIEHPQIWSDLGRAARIRVEEEYDVDRLNNELVKIYRQLLSDQLR
jgi:colanic acid/amylovoran/stewartan biosynthesis glycosyltransferase WcaL/AmsK/CpsK